MSRIRLPARPRTVAALALTALLALPCAAAPALAADDPPAKPAQEPTAEETAKQWIDELKPKIGKEDEATARASIARLAGYGKDAAMSADIKKAAADCLEKYAKDDEHVAIAVAAIDGMAELPPDLGGKAILPILNRALKAKEPPVDLYGACLRGLKKLADPSKATTGTLVDLLKRKENDIIGKAADALSGYKDAPGKLRRDLMEEVLKIGESAFQAAQGGKDSNAMTKWNTIQIGIMAALRSLSGQSLADPVAARRWYNDHKKDAKVWG